MAICSIHGGRTQFCADTKNPTACMVLIEVCNVWEINPLEILRNNRKHFKIMNNYFVVKTITRVISDFSPFVQLTTVLENGKVVRCGDLRTIAFETPRKRFGLKVQLNFSFYKLPCNLYWLWSVPSFWSVEMERLLQVIHFPPLRLYFHYCKSTVG